MKTICWLNGKFMDVSKARISPLDRGFLFGEGLFETWRTYKGRPYAVEDHLERMAGSAAKIGIPFDPKEPWSKRCIELAKRNGMLKEDGAVRFTITRGHGPFGFAVEKTEDPTSFMMFRPLDPLLGAAKKDGVSVHLVSMGTGVSEKQRQVKSLNYLPAILARQEAKKVGAFEAIYFIEKPGDKTGGTVLEGTTSNVFLVSKGVVRTAPISLGLLPGVTRSKTLRVAAKVTKVKEERFTIADLVAADEVFLTASSIEVVPVVRVGRKKIGKGRPGPVTLEMQRRYREEVAARTGLDISDLGA